MGRDQAGTKGGYRAGQSQCPARGEGGVLEAAGAEAFSLKTRWKGARGITEKLGINQG